MGEGSGSLRRRTSTTDTSRLPCSTTSRDVLYTITCVGNLIELPTLQARPMSPPGSSIHSTSLTIVLGNRIYRHLAYLASPCAVQGSLGSEFFSFCPSKEPCHLIWFLTDQFLLDQHNSSTQATKEGDTHPNLWSCFAFVRDIVSRTISLRLAALDET